MLAIRAATSSGVIASSARSPKNGASQTRTPDSTARSVAGL